MVIYNRGKLENFDLSKNTIIINVPTRINIETTISHKIFIKKKLKRSNRKDFQEDEIAINW